MDPAGLREEAVPGQTGEAGFSLPVVLWSLLLASLLVITFLAASRTSIRIAANDAGRAEATALAEAGISLAVLDLVAASRRQGVERRIPVDGTPAECRMPDGARIRLRVEDEGGKIDLNRADEILLRYVLAGLGHTPSEASRLADRILDYRDPDELRRLNGAEREEYLRSGIALGPADGPFLTGDEIGQVLDMPPKTAERLQALLTVYSESPGIDLGVAPSELVRVLHLGLTGADGVVIDADTPAGRAALPLPPVYRARSAGTVYRVEAHALAPDGSETRTLAVVQLIRRRNQAYRFLRWSAGVRSREDIQDSRKPARDLGAC